jgi:hypothetical protein
LPSIATSLDPPAARPAARRSTRGEAFLERVGVQAGEDAAERVVAGHAAGQVQERGEPRALGAAELLDLDPPVGAADHGADGDDQDVVQLVDHVVRPRVGKLPEEAQNTSGRLSVHGKLLALIV